MVTANVAVPANTRAAACPCQVTIDLVSNNGNAQEGGAGTAVGFDIPGGPVDDGGLTRITQSITRVFLLPALTSDSYRLTVDVVDGNVNQVTGTAQIVSLYVPFNGTGGNIIPRNSAPTCSMGCALPSSSRRV
jgi:hypothetical protein